METVVDILSRQLDSATREIEILSNTLETFCNERHITKGPNSEKLNFKDMTATERLKWAGFLVRLLRS